MNSNDFLIAEAQPSLAENAGRTAAGDEGEIKNGNPDANASGRDTRVEQADTRTDQANTRTQQANTRTQEAEARTDQANARTDQANTRTDQANTRTEQANTRTEQAEARSVQAIRASELRYRRLFETAQDGILILDADTGHWRPRTGGVSKSNSSATPI